MFGVTARSGSGKDNWTQIRVDRDDYDTGRHTITDDNKEDTGNNLSGTWISGHNKGTKMRLKVESNNIHEYVIWWGVRISEKNW